MSAMKSVCGVSFEVIERDQNMVATTWIATCDCGCGSRFADGTYEATEDKWRKHRYEATGVAPKPMGDKTNRWMP